MEVLRKQHIVINLDKRTDRLQQVTADLHQLGITDINRLSAVENKEHGLIGCTQSHINALKLAMKNGWDKVLIFEDDVEFRNPFTLMEKIEKYENHNWDVLMLGAEVLDGSLIKKDLIRVKKGYCLHGYIVRCDYYRRLIGNLEEGLVLKKRDPKNQDYNNDVYMNKIVKEDKWYCLANNLCNQRIGWSDNFGMIHDQQYRIANPRLDFK